jgi:hypothetical protein
MNKVIRIISISVIVLSVILLTGCESHKDTTSNDVISNVSSTNQDEEGNNDAAKQEVDTTSTTSIENLPTYNWELLKNYGQDIGSKMQEIIETAHMDLINFDKGGQIAGTLESVYYYAPCPNYDNSTCTAILTNGWDIFPEGVSSLTVDDINRYFGEGYIYNESDGKNAARLEYNFEKYMVTFYLNSNYIMEINDMCIEISSKNKSVDPQEIIEAYERIEKMDSQNRNSEKWAAINENLNLFNKNEAEIMNDLNWQFIQGQGYYGGDYYENESTKVRLVFARSGECVQILIPNTRIYGDLSNNNLDMNWFYKYWGAPFSWGDYEDAGYTISFEDLKVVIPSNHDGNIDIKNYTIINNPE